MDTFGCQCSHVLYKVHLRQFKDCVLVSLYSQHQCLLTPCFMREVRPQFLFISHERLGRIQTGLLADETVSYWIVMFLGRILHWGLP